MDSDDFPSINEPLFRHSARDDYYHPQMTSPLISSTTHHRPIISEPAGEELMAGIAPHRQLEGDASSKAQPNDEFISVLHEAEVLLEMLQQQQSATVSGQDSERAKTTELTPGTAAIIPDLSMESFFPFLKSLGVRFEVEGAMNNYAYPTAVTVNGASTIDAASALTPPNSSQKSHFSTMASSKGLDGGTLSATLSLEVLLAKYKSFTLSHSTHNPSTVYRESIAQGIQHRAALRDSAVLMHNLDTSIQHRATHMTMWESSVRRWIAEETKFLEQFHSPDASPAD